MDGVIIRSAKIDDIGKIQLLSQKLFEYEYAKLGNRISNLNWSMSIDGKNNFRYLIQNGIVYVSEYNNTIIGYVCGEICKRQPWQIVQFAELINLYVLDEYRGKGIATGLINQFKKACKNSNIRYIKLSMLSSNISAANCYIRNGFSEYIKEFICRLD